MPVRPQRDLTNEGCYNTAAQSKVTLKQFRQLICDHCHNPECVHAKWGMTPFDLRVQTWKERLFGNQRIVSDLSLPRHLQIFNNEFPDATAKALKLIVSTARNDWSYVDDDGGGGPKVSNPSTTSKVDEAVKKLAEKLGRKAPEPPPSETPLSPEERLEQESSDAEKQLEQEAEKTKEDREPADASAPDQVPQPEHSDGESWTEEELDRARRKDEAAGLSRRPPPSLLGNTPMPAEGFMLEGPRSSSTKQPEHDSWAPKKKDTVVEPGSKIVLGGKDKDDDKS